MMTEDTKKYEEWLTTIANTRLIYNTMDELETKLDAHSIHSNGIKRCFNSQQRMRAAFRDLKVETSLMTNNQIDLCELLELHKATWEFYRDFHLRRTTSESFVIELMRYVSHPFCRSGVSKRRVELFDEIVKRDVCIPILILMILKVIPGYDSKGGDVTDMNEQYERVMALLDRFVADAPGINVAPAIAVAREEKQKTRLMLIYHVARVIATYQSYANTQNLYNAADDAKHKRVALQMNGYWNECGGKLLNTDFWLFHSNDSDGSFYASHWHKDGNNRLTGVRYCIFFNVANDGRLLAFILHPRYITNAMKGEETEARDKAWYIGEMPRDNAPERLTLERYLPSDVWPAKIELTRVTDEAVAGCYDGWFGSCRIERPFGNLEYEFHQGISAITKQFIYIPTGNEREYFQVPKSIHEGFDHIKLDDKVGTLEMDGRTYLVFDELMLYIDTNISELKRYGIKVVASLQE
jgi:hypothetical protein